MVSLKPLELHVDPKRGIVAVLEDIPFKVKRMFTIYNVPMREMRGGHAHRKCHQLFLCVCGCIVVKMGDGKQYVLDCPDTALYVPPLHIVNLMFMTEDTTLLVLASEKFDKNDYIYGDAND